MPSPPTAPLEIRQIAANTVVISWGRPESDGGAPLEGYKIAIRDAKKTMWMEVGKVNAETQKLNIRDLQENHMYLIRIFARNEVGHSDPLESDEPVKIIPASGTSFLIYHFRCSVKGTFENFEKSWREDFGNFLVILERTLI